MEVFAALQERGSVVARSLHQGPLKQAGVQRSPLHNAVWARQHEVVVHPVERLLDQALKHLVHQEHDVLGVGALHFHQQLTVTVWVDGEMFYFILVL